VRKEKCEKRRNTSTLIEVKSESDEKMTKSKHHWQKSSIRNDDDDSSGGRFVYYVVFSSTHKAVAVVDHDD
jgi:hypothetical protein